jgi:hypothetical protein
MFYVENDKLGRVMVGRYNIAGAVNTIDLGGISAGASSSEVLIGGNLALRGPGGQYYGMVLGATTDAAANQARQNLIRYDSEVWNGFTYSASLAEDGSIWGTMLRYAGEFSGFRIAAGIGYEHDGQTSATISPSGPSSLAQPAPNVNAWGGSLAALHVPTGLFLQGHYMRVDFDEDSPTTVAPVNAFWGQNFNGQRPADQWLIQGGITKNWTGFGNTAFFGEYSKNTGWGAGGGTLAPNGVDYKAAPGGTPVNGVTDTEMTMYGFGITQNVDAAATELYLDARHFSADVTCSASANCTGKDGSAPGTKLQTEDMWVVVGGARVKF